MLNRILPLLLLLSLLGCRKNELINQVTYEEPPPKVLVVSSFQGKVVDENGDPIKDAQVIVYFSHTTTDENGLFKLKNIDAPKGAALVEVRKNGYFTACSMSGNTSGSQQYVRVTMMQKGASKTLDAVEGGTLTWPSGLKITIGPNKLRYAGGGIFSGKASVFARWLDPTDPELGNIMPGALMARNASGAEKVLSTFGMTALKLEDANGNELLLRTGETVAIEMPIPQELLASAPQEIALWNFDLQQERWMEYGTCHYSGSSSYICNVNGSGFWNCDIALEPICLSGTFFQSDSTPAFYTRVVVEDLSNNFIYWGYTDINGYFCGAVPKDAPLKITVTDLCGNILYEANIGPFSADTDLGDIYLTQTLQQYQIHISGQLKDCFGNFVLNGQVAVEYPGKVRLFPLDASGAFDFDLALNCIEFPELQITGYDLANFRSTPVQFHSDENDVDFGILTACEEPADFLTIQVDGSTYNLAPTRFFLKNNEPTNWLVLEGLTIGGFFSINIQEYAGVGTYTSNTFMYTYDAPELPSYPFLYAGSPGITVNITGDYGNLIVGNLTCTALDPQNVPHTVTGIFKVKKEI
ncbi:MAG TPA: carboxypeptidase-like regulatory domain-containing protein [Saprospiraceae bacterium]|nr:carboxypeptidase-like regulatory domain-containing protein [Saprospiraceae bacterium]HPI05800.1 carboxypeptidase-like regulatory domain-containing protein [Saprospiraceae bacterium]